MPEISDTALGARIDFAPLPPFATPEEVLADCLPQLDPPSLMTVTEAAEMFVRVPVAGDWQRFDRQQTPYLVEPADMMQSRRYQGAVFMGPAQSGKTMMLQTVAAHAVTCDPKPVLIVHMTATDRNNWIEDKLDPMIMNSPELRRRLGQGREDSTFARKRFRGMRLTLGYPTAQTFSSHSYGMVLLTDYDRMKQVLGRADRPEGRPFAMARQRVKTWMSRGMVLAESAPNYPVAMLEWAQPEGSPHMMPPVEGGIAQLYNQGTRGRFYWECPDCGNEFEPRFDRLHYDADLDPADAGSAAQMMCPHCGSLIDHRHKLELNRAVLRGRGGWRHETSDGGVAALDDPAVRASDVVSWALNGAAATFASWSEIVTKYETARRQFQELGDDTDLATVHYNDIGVPHRRPRREGESDLSYEAMRDHAHQAPRGTAPAWARCVTITVDVQGSYFPVQVTAWDEEGNAAVIDRFDLTQPPENAPNAEPDADGHRRKLDPARYAEDWQVLEGLADRVIPVEGASYGLKPVALGVDFQGAPGVSDNAEAFWRGRAKAGQGRRWYLTRGQGGFRVPFRAVHELPDRGSKGKKARGVKLLTMAVDRLKDTVHAGLGRVIAGGGGAIWMPAWMFAEDAPPWAAEMLSEERTGKGWELKKGIRRNEGIDLTVQARALIEIKGLRKIDPAAPPAWAVGGAENVNAVALGMASPAGSGGVEGPDAAAADAATLPKRVRRSVGRLF